MLRVGLTGGIGAGKSTAAGLLAARGAVVIDADGLAREVVEPGTPGLAEVVAAFGPQVLTADGALDRASLGRLVFSDEAARTRLNAILHPRIAALTGERMRAAGDDAIVVHDVPLLVENRMGAAYHLVIVVHTDLEERVRRLVVSRGMPESDARGRVAAQADDEARRAAADVWLDNSGSPQDLVGPIDALWTARLAPYAENLRRCRPAAAPVAPDPDPGREAATSGRDVATGARERVVSRILRAMDVGAAAGPVTLHGIDDGAGSRPVEIVLEISGPTVAEAVKGPLAEVGYFRDPDGGRQESLYRGADPAQEVSVLVRTVDRDG